MAGNVGTETRNVAGALTSMGIDEMISNLAIGIARGQMSLDQASMQIAQFMGEARIAFGKKPGSDIPDLVSLIELGFTPNFYQFVDTILELKVSVSTQYSETRSTDVSQTRMHQNSSEQNQNYESNRSNSYGGSSARSSSSSGYNYGRSYGGGWGWRGWSFGYGGHGSSHASSSSSSNYYSGASSSAFQSSSSAKQKSMAMTTVDAKFSSKYNYSVEASSTVKTKIVPVPPPEVFEEIIREAAEKRREEEQRFIWKQEVKALLPDLRNIAESVFTKDADGIPTGLFSEVSLNLETDTHLERLKSGRKKLKALVAKYARLTNDHWAIIDDIANRETADDAIEAMVPALERLITASPLQNPPKPLVEAESPPADGSTPEPAEEPSAYQLTDDEVAAFYKSIKQQMLDIATAAKRMHENLLEMEAEDPDAPPPA